MKVSNQCFAEHGRLGGRGKVRTVLSLAKHFAVNRRDTFTRLFTSYIAFTFLFMTRCKSWMLAWIESNLTPLILDCPPMMITSLSYGRFSTLTPSHRVRQRLRQPASLTLRSRTMSHADVLCQRSMQSASEPQPTTSQLKPSDGVLAHTFETSKRRRFDVDRKALLHGYTE